MAGSYEKNIGKFLVLLGPPGAGKGTQSKRLAGQMRLVHIAPGDVLREERSSGTELGKEVGAVMDQGRLVSDEIICAVIAERLRRMESLPVLGAIFDGFPRTVEQAQWLDQYLGEQGWRIGTAISLDVSDEEAIRRNVNRLTCPKCQRTYRRSDQSLSTVVMCVVCAIPLVSRTDDTEDKLRIRLQTYRQQTIPVLAYYEKKRILMRVSGNGDPEDVFRRLYGVVHTEKDDENIPENA